MYIYINVCNSCNIYVNWLIMHVYVHIFTRVKGGDAFDIFWLLLIHYLLQWKRPSFGLSRHAARVPSPGKPLSRRLATSNLSRLLGGQAWTIRVWASWDMYPPVSGFRGNWTSFRDGFPSRLRFLGIFQWPDLAIAVSRCSQHIRDAHGAVSGHLPEAARRNNMEPGMWWKCPDRIRKKQTCHLNTCYIYIYLIYPCLDIYSFTFHSQDCDHQISDSVHAWTSSMEFNIIRS